jgi:hypothetical protein
MSNEDIALDDVARIHPALDRLRKLVASATLLDLKATSAAYWADRRVEADPPTPSTS